MPAAPLRRFLTFFGKSLDNFFPYRYNKEVSIIVIRKRNIMKRGIPMPNLYGIDFTFRNLPENYRADLTPLSDENGIKRIGVHFDIPENTIPDPVTLVFEIPLINMMTAYYPLIGQFRQSRSLKPMWIPVTVESRVSGGEPLFSVIGHDENNSFTFTVDDVKTPIRIYASVIEETARLRMKVEFFYVAPGVLSAYDTALRLDFRTVPYTDALHDAEVYLAEVSDASPCYTPEEATYPMYSTWYSYHQKFDTEALVAECREATKMGMRAIIVDDGWQTDDNNRGYAYCGDWQITPNKIPDIHDLVSRIHALGMKVIFWYSVPFIGKHAALYPHFRDMLLDDPDNDWGMLDPRFPEVREFLIGKYVEAVRDWHLDGLKLDFIDSFALSSFSKKDDPRMDYADLYAACDRLMTDVRTAVQNENPEVMIEFRQAYIGTAVQSYGNMFRVGDCPNDALTNRLSAMDMRLVMHRVAVHSDMLMWHPDDTVESAARQLLNVFFTVPQISVRLSEIRPEHKKMLDHYLSVWTQHRDVLLFGSFLPEGVDGSYTYLHMDNENEVFKIDFGKNVCRVGDRRPVTYLNVTSKKHIYLDLVDPRHVTVFAPDGTVAEDRTYPAGIHVVSVPLSGMMTVR